MDSYGFIKFRQFSFNYIILIVVLVFFSVKNNMDSWIALISALILKLVIRCNMLIYRKKNPALNLFSFPLLRDVCQKYIDLLFFIIVPQLYHRIRVHGLDTGFYLTSHSLKHALRCFATVGGVLCFPYLFAIHTSKDKCSVRVIFPVSPTFSINRVYSTSQKHVS